MSTIINKQHLNYKDKLRIFLFPKIAFWLNKLGVSWKFLGEKLGSVVLIGQAYAFAKNKNFPKAHKQEEVIMLTMLGGHIFNASIDVALAWSLMEKGYKVKAIIDDYFLPITENHKPGHEHRYDYISYRDYIIGSEYFKSARIPFIRLSEIVKNENWEAEDIKQFSYVVEASLFKHYKVGILTDDLPLIEKKKNLFENSVKITSVLGRKLVKEAPQLVIMSHGIYSTWGPAFAHLKNAQIPIITYGRGKKAFTEKFNWNHTGDWWDVSKEWEKIKDIPLSSLQLEQINNYLDARITHKNDALVYNFGGLESKDELRSKYGLDPSKVTFSLFTNVLWDAASAQREIAFNNPIQWVIETIQWFKDHPDKQLVVKIHPAEVVIGTNQPFESILRKNIDSIPGNVFIIPPSAIINSWSVYEITDMGIVHTTTAGMELPLIGKPCIVVSKTHFRDKGFTVDVKSKEEYFKILSDFNPTDFDKAEVQKLKDLSLKYSHLLFERYQLPFKLFNEYGSLNIKSFRFNNLNELIHDRDLSFVTDCIEKKAEFLLPQ